MQNQLANRHAVVKRHVRSIHHQQQLSTSPM